MDAEGIRPQISGRFARVPLFPNSIFSQEGDIQLSTHEPVLEPFGPFLLMQPGQLGTMTL